MRHFDLSSFYVGGMLACCCFVIAETRRGLGFRESWLMQRVPWLIVLLLVASLVFWPAMLGLLIYRSGQPAEDDDEDDDDDEISEA